jgi:hypothetical protein
MGRRVDETAKRCPAGNLRPWQHAHGEQRGGERWSAGAWRAWRHPAGWRGKWTLCSEQIAREVGAAGASLSSPAAGSGRSVASVVSSSAGLASLAFPPKTSSSSSRSADRIAAESWDVRWQRCRRRPQAPTVYTAAMPVTAMITPTAPDPTSVNTTPRLNASSAIAAAPSSANCQPCCRLSASV